MNLTLECFTTSVVKCFILRGSRGDAASVGTATKEITKEANNVGKTAESVVSEAVEIAGIVERLQNDLQKLIEKRTQMLNDFLEKKA